MNKIQIYEVGPRDGFQNVNEYISVKDKVSVIENMVETGVRNIQLTSFVSPKAIPQMKDSKEVAKICLQKFPNVNFFALVPNLYGADTSWNSGIYNISFVVSLSKSHNKANINRTHEESFNELKSILDKYPKINVCLDLATTFGCPFEGKFNLSTIIEFIRNYVDLGIKEINLCDTIGVSNPKQVREVVKALQNEFPKIEFQVHIHDTRNMGMVNTLAAIESGISKIQSTLGGLGGCPFAPGASGNLATEDVIYMLNEMGYDTGVDTKRIIKAAKYEKTIIDGIYSGHQVNIDTLT